LDPDPKFPEKSDPDPKKIISDPQHWTTVRRGLVSEGTDYRTGFDRLTSLQCPDTHTFYVDPYSASLANADPDPGTNNICSELPNFLINYFFIQSYNYFDRYRYPRYLLVLYFLFKKIGVIG